MFYCCGGFIEESDKYNVSNDSRASTAIKISIITAQFENQS